MGAAGKKTKNPYAEMNGVWIHKSARRYGANIFAIFAQKYLLILTESQNNAIIDPSDKSRGEHAHERLYPAYLR